MSQSTKKTNQILLAVAAVLLLLSAWTYRQSVERAERFERGQKFLPNLNPDEISRIELLKGDEQLVLRRDDGGERFTVVSADGYRATNGAVNRLIRDVLELSLEKEVGRGESLQEELGLAAAGDGRDADTLEVVLVGDGGQDMVRFLVGGASEGSGTYVRRIDGDDGTIYLTDERVFLNTDEGSYVDKEILDVPPGEVARIAGPDFVFSVGEGETGGELALLDVPAGRRSSPRARQVATVLQGLRFVEHHLADAPEVQGLRFDRQLEVILDDGAAYLLESATDGDKHYLRLTARHTSDKIVGGRILMSPEAGDEEMKSTSELMARADELQRFNAYHGSWIYEVTENTADRVRARKADLLEDV